MATQTFSVRELIQPLTESENTELIRVLQNPVVIKHFKNIAYTAILEQSFIPVTAMSKEHDFLYELAYQKGIFAMAESILNGIPVKSLESK